MYSNQKLDNNVIICIVIVHRHILLKEVVPHKNIILPWHDRMPLLDRKRKFNNKYTKYYYDEEQINLGK